MKIGDALVQLPQSTTVSDSMRYYAAKSLGTIDPGNQDAIAALVQLLQSQDVDDDTRIQAADSLRTILQDNQYHFEVVKALSSYW